MFVPAEDVVVVGEDPAGESGAEGCCGASAGYRGASAGWLVATAEVTAGTEAGIRECGVMV